MEAKQIIPKQTQASKQTTQHQVKTTGNNTTLQETNQRQINQPIKLTQKLNRIITKPTHKV